MSKVYVSELAGEPLIDYLSAKGLEVHLEHGCASENRCISNSCIPDSCATNCASKPLVDVNISTHADIYRCQLGLLRNAHIYNGNRRLPHAPYPDEAIYNAVATDKLFIHRLDITAPDLLNHINGLDHLSKINVSQGYTRCSLLPVTDNSFITSDPGVAKVLNSAGADVLLVTHDMIKLQGYSYGFIGGCAGNLLIDNIPTLLFNGDLSSHPDYKRITAFAEDRDYEIKYFPNYPLEDIGSILFEY